MARIIAIASDPNQVLALRLASQVKGHELIVVSSCDDALRTIERRTPDSLICGLFLTPEEDAALAPRLRFSNVEWLNAAVAPGVSVSPSTSTRTHKWIKLVTPSPGAAYTCGPRDFLAVMRSLLEPDQASSEPLDDSWSALSSLSDDEADEDNLDASTLPVERDSSESVATRVTQGLARLTSVCREAASKISGRVRGAAVFASRLPLRYVGWILAPTAVLAVLIGVGRHTNWLAARPAASAPSKDARVDPVARPMPKKTGSLQVTSEPEGAAVVLDGRLRGVAPLMIEDVAPGAHVIELKSRSGSVRRSVTVRAGETISADGAIFPGWLVMFSPVDLQISEGGRPLRLDDNHQVVLAPGRHELLLVNKALGYRSVTVADIKPGERTALSVVLPKTSLSITTTPASEVWIDGERAGETPLVDVPVDIGGRDVVLKNTSHGDRHLAVTATVAPVRLDIDLTKP